MIDFVLRTDAVEVAGTVMKVWFEPFYPLNPISGTWHVVIQLKAGDPLLVTSDGKVNAFDWIECLVTPVAPFRDLPNAARLLGEIAGQEVRLAGSWGDLTLDGHGLFTRIMPVAWIVVNHSLTAIIEEHGFSQAVRDVDLFAFSDDTPTDIDGPLPPHHRENRHFELTIPFPFKPQPSATPVRAECVDRENLEQLRYGFRQNSAPEFPYHSVLMYRLNIIENAAGDVLQFVVDTGTPAEQKGFFYAKIALTYNEPFDKMCDPNVCLTDPGRSCQATNEQRYTYVWPRVASALSGNLLLGPAGGKGVLGRLLGALHGPQHYDHMAMFVEDDGRTVRHCTADDERIASEEYYTATVSIETPFGDAEKKLPLLGIRNDVLRFAWPGSITQSIAEVCLTGQNRLNPQFSFARLYHEVITAEIADPPHLWELAPAERAKRTAFHDPEAVGTAKRERKPNKRAKYTLVKVQRDPAYRAEINPETGQPIGFIYPMLVQPHPSLAKAAQEPLRYAAEELKKIVAHYRFFSYSDAGIALNPAYNAPPTGAWGGNEGVGWAANSIAAVCSSIVWAAVQAANTRLVAGGKRRIELEGEGELEDNRLAAGPDGLYHYTVEERADAAKALFEFTHDRVANEVRKAVDDLPGLATTLIDVIPGLGSTIEAVGDALGNIVANQLVNTFASDGVGDLAFTWNNPGPGIAVSPDDTLLRWDVRVPLNGPPPAISPNKINVYGQSTPVDIPQPAWRYERIYRVRASVGKGTVRGTVVRRLEADQDPTEVIGATVRMGCDATVTTQLEGRIGFEFVDVKAGRYLLQAWMYVVDPVSNVGQEWKSKPQDVGLSDGDIQDGYVLELFPPDGLARTVYITTHHDIVDRVVVGKDRWGHPDMNGKIQLAFDPLDVPAAPDDQKNTCLEDAWDQTTPEVGSGVHVRVRVAARLNKIIAADATHTFDGSVTCDVRLWFFDSGEGETNDTLEQLNINLPLGASHTIPYNMVSDDTVPERASGTIMISNLIATLP